ncbi:hypothetical protein ACVV55_15050, partial [Enterococcus faecalis]
SWEPPNQTTKNGFTVHVTNSYEARMLLKNRSYRYFTLGKAWEKEISTKQEAEQEAAFLKQRFPMIQISVLRPVEALLCMHYYIGV